MSVALYMGRLMKEGLLGCDIQARERAFQIKRPTQAQTLRQQRACFLFLFFVFLIN